MPNFIKEEGCLLIHVDGVELVWCPCECEEQFLEEDSGECDYGYKIHKASSCRTCPEAKECLKRFMHDPETGRHNSCNTWIEWDDAQLNRVYAGT